MVRRARANSQPVDATHLVCISLSRIHRHQPSRRLWRIPRWQFVPHLLASYIMSRQQQQEKIYRHPAGTRLSPSSSSSSSRGEKQTTRFLSFFSPPVFVSSAFLSLSLFSPKAYPRDDSQQQGSEITEQSGVGGEESEREREEPKRQFDEGRIIVKHYVKLQAAG